MVRPAKDVGGRIKASWLALSPFENSTKAGQGGFYEGQCSMDGTDDVVPSTGKAVEDRDEEVVKPVNNVGSKKPQRA